MTTLHCDSSTSQAIDAAVVTKEPKETRAPTDLTWSDVLGPEKEKPYFIDLMNFVGQQRAQNIPIYPAAENVFNALKLTPYDKVKVVIIGQDPYHGPGQAHGLSFSVPEGVPFPPSLENIFKELHQDLAIPRPTTGCLTPWATQGVLLLNAVLTVREGSPGSHANRGWERFTDTIIASLNQSHDHLVFLLWGNYAKQKAKDVDSHRHLVLLAAHPSPLSASRGFFGCKHFSKANEYLAAHQRSPINWSL